MAIRIRQREVLNKYRQRTENGHFFFRKDDQQYFKQNQLARRLAVESKYSGQSRETIFSEYLTGERAMPNDHAHKFCEELGLSKVEEDKLLEAIKQDKESIEHTRHEILSPHIYEFIEGAEQNFSTAYKLRIHGNSSEALEVSEAFLGELVNYLNEHKNLPSYARRDLLKIKSDLICERIEELKETNPRFKIFGIVKPYLGDLQKIASWLNDKEISANIGLVLGDTYYIIKDMSEAIKAQEKALPNLKLPIHKLDTLRGLALGYGYMGVKKNCISTANDCISAVLNDAENVPEERIISVLIACARAYGLVGDIRSLYLFKEAEDRLNEGQKNNQLMPHRKLQFYSSMQEVLPRVVPTDMNFQRQISEEAVKLAKLHRLQYPRHAETIILRANNILN